jgi:PPOX class probable F420-dependent enzyme
MIRVGIMLDQELLKLAHDKNFAVLSTLMPDGRPATQVMWVDADEESILINTQVDRQKWRNVQRDSRVTVTVWDRENPYHFAEVRGRVASTIEGQEARDHIDHLSMKYHGHEYQNPVTAPRVMLRVIPDKVIWH